MTGEPTLLTLHAVRLLGFAPTGAVAGRFGLDRATAAEDLEDFRARGWVTWSEFAGSGGWSLTDAGRAENERLLAVQLDAAGGREVLEHAHGEFRKLNDRVLRAITHWQIRPTPWDALAANDHTDWRWDQSVLRDLRGVGRRLVPLTEQVSGVLPRMAGYDHRYAAALERVDRGQRSWVDATGVDSCHTVWFQLHEDLLATLGIHR